ncbi:granulocyte colony-stimulating factor receptor isoform X2 [Sceloporus undulatus]|uniref:granulocyte colony-stimulating factor receptor isoform X2 n=1 Tax=Sceloporus undulatus TaxID=8520 RepID=UPI001C4D20FC|nr:granulocyte colony-stimulating factor receptor isoform X2 [Sceloporus undulatus]
MAAPQEAWRRLLACAIFSLLLPGASSSSCSNIAVDAPAVLWGGNVSASCTIWRHHCRFQEDGETQVMWKWDKDFLNGTQHSFGDSGVEVSNITIGPLNRTLTTLSCWVQKKGTPQIMNLTHIHAGYPPSEPQNLTCVMNVTTKDLTCHWDPGQDGLLPASVTLHSVQTDKDCQVQRAAIPPCVPPAGQSSCTIPRQDFQLYQYVMLWVSVENVLGTVQSRPLCADPTDLVKLDPPTLRAVQSFPEETDCVMVAWDGAEGSRYMQQACELRYRTDGDQEWMLVEMPNIAPSTWQTQHCGLRFGTFYGIQMRCKRLPLSYWSDWSPLKNFTTHEKAPSGKLVTWWNAKPQKPSKGTEVQLMWKPMRPEETNGKILGYWATLSPRLTPGKSSSTLCNTTELQCTFSLPSGTQRVFLVAYNSKGVSPPTEVVLVDKRDQPIPKIRASPLGEKTIRVFWDALRTPAPLGYILEWRRVASEDLAEDGVRWMKLGNGSAMEALIQDIQPFQRYNISVSPLYKDGPGMPQYVEAYTLQKAPSQVPKLHAGNISKSTADLSWEPIPVEKRNGFITNYTIFWSSTNEDMRSAIVNSSVGSFILRGLWPSRMYQVHIMASTVGGSTNGTTLTLYTKAMDDMDISFVYLLVGLLLLMIIVLVICFHKSKRMKTQFWPNVPDPANSSLGKWAPAVLQEEIPPAPKACELSPVIVSAILVIDTEEKKCLSCGKSEPTKALEEGSPTASQRSYACDPSNPTLVTSVALPASYVNSPESVQYAKVVGDPYRCQEEASPMFYVRSNSTQPLLGNLTPSPKPYENLWFRGDRSSCESNCQFQEEAFFLDRALLDFPLLQGLRVDGEDDLGNFRRV